MKAWELIGYSRRCLKGKRREIFLICSLPLGAELLFRALESAIYSLLLYFGTFKPVSLFTGENTQQLAVSAVFAVLRLTVCPPLWCAAAVRLREFTEGASRRTSFQEMLLNGRFIRRSISAFFTGKLFSGAVLAPGLASAYLAVRILSYGADSSELFIAVNGIVLTAVSVTVWILLKLSLTAVPWILAAYPEKSGSSAVLAAIRFMRGRRSLPVKLLIAYILPAVTVIGLPFVIPEAAAAYSQAVSIFMKEDEYAGEPIFRRKRSRQRRRRISGKKDLRESI